MQPLSPIETALGNHAEVPEDWLPASQVRPFFDEDPALVWLEYHGARHGFAPDPTPFLDFIAEKGGQFERKWRQEMAPEAVWVCKDAYEARRAEKVRETFDLMGQGAPVIAQAALWWAPERIYGAPDLIAHSTWLKAKFPSLWDALATPPGTPEHYIVFDVKFSSNLDRSDKAKDLAAYAAQVRLYTYMLGHLQGSMPRLAFLVARDRVSDPLPVQITSTYGQALDEDLAGLREQFVEIKLNGAKYTPWKDVIVASNPGNQDERWRTAKEHIAREMIPGGDASLLYQVGPKASQALAELGYPSLAVLLAAEPESIPLEKVKGIGAKKAGQIRAVLSANRTQQPVLPPASLVPAPAPNEFYIDYEYFPNLNVDFERQWPGLEGREMVFMIGAGWEQDGSWQFKRFTAAAEDQVQEQAIFEELIAFLQAHTANASTDPTKTAIYHWSSAEVWQTNRVAERHELDEAHPLRNLPWVNLQKTFLDGPAALPGAMDFGLKTVAGAIGALDADCASTWPEELDEGQLAMLLAWKAYESPDALASKEMSRIGEYLQADCRSMWNILRWLRKRG